MFSSLIPISLVVGFMAMIKELENNMEQNWFYAMNNSSTGPVTLDEMKALINADVIKHDTLVWNGAGEWIKAQQSALAEFLKAQVLTPPALPGNKPLDLQKNMPPQADKFAGYKQRAAQIILGENGINNRFISAQVLVLIIQLALTPMVASGSGFWLFISLIFSVIYLVLAFKDHAAIKATGQAPSKWWFLFIFTYLYKRAKRFQQIKFHFWATIVVCALNGATSIHYTRISMLETSACSIVTDIYKRQFYNNAQCVAVNIDSKIAKNLYKGSAIMSDGNEADITVREMADDNIYVSVER